MLFTVLIPLMTQLVIPLGMLAWLLMGRHRNRAVWAAGAALLALYLGAMNIAGLWLILPWFMPFVYAALLVIVLASTSRVAALPIGPQKSWEWATMASLIVAGGAVGSLVLNVTWNRQVPGAAVPLKFPMRGGTYLVVNGGGNTLINAHLATLEGERFKAYRGQSYGVDLVRITRLGLRARGMVPAEPTLYAIFGDTVYAPCTGTVVRTETDHPDMPPPQPDRRHMAGNYVLLDCGHAWVLMGHLLRGSVRVVEGQHADTGLVLGQVGNSGNSQEPHLHIHAQRPGTPNRPLGGQPLGLRFGHNYPARNDRIRP